MIKLIFYRIKNWGMSISLLLLYEKLRKVFFSRLNEYHHTTRPHMRAAYFAYLQNTPGSRKAIYDCMKEVTSPKKKEEPAPQAVAWFLIVEHVKKMW